MNILFIRTTEGVSGAEVYTVHLVNGLRKYTNIKSSVITNYMPFAQLLQRNGINTAITQVSVPEVGTKRTFVKAAMRLPTLLGTYFAAIRTLEKDGKFDVVVLESMTEKLFLTPILYRMGYKTVWLEHGPLYTTGRTGWVKFMYRKMSVYANGIIAVSEDTKTDLVSHGLPSAFVHAVHLGLPQEIFRASAGSGDKLKENLHIPPGVKMIGYLSSVCPEKGIGDFIDLAKRAENPKDSYFLVVGGGPALEETQRRVAKSQLGNRFVFTGPVSDPLPYISLMDVLYFPTRHQEGASVALMYALGKGIPVVARDMGGNRELVKNGKTGYLFTHNAEGEKLVSEILDGRKGAGLGKNAIKHIGTSFSAETQSKLFAGIFRGI